MKNIFSLGIFLFLAGNFCAAQHSKNILYGEHLDLKKETSNTARIFYDRNGDLYPEGYISNEALENAGGALKNYFKKAPDQFQKSALQYLLTDQQFSESNYQILQDSILSNIIRHINKKSQTYNEVQFLVHGFRKPFERKKGSSSSVQNNQNLKSAIVNQQDLSNQLFFIELYWDGMFDCCFSKNIFKNRKIFKLFKNEARRNAEAAGYQLRKVVSKINKEKVSFISHSLGARVLVACLFNAFDNNKENSRTDLPTPHQRQIQVCMIAPAISKKPFENFYQRNTDIDFKTKDNYRLFILYNEEDFALKKKWKGLGPGPKRHGRTTLGCNHKKEIFKLGDLFENKYSASYLEVSHADDIGICHSLGCYTGSVSFEKLIGFLDFR